MKILREYLSDSIQAFFRKSEVRREIKKISATSTGGELPYKVYTALLNQSGEDIPTEIVQYDTIGGSPVFSRESSGFYKLTNAGKFPENKTFCCAYLGSRDDGEGKYSYFPNIRRVSDDVIEISTHSRAGDIEDNYLEDYPLEIRVYP